MCLPMYQLYSHSAFPNMEPPAIICTARACSTTWGMPQKANAATSNATTGGRGGLRPSAPLSALPPLARGCVRHQPYLPTITAVHSCNVGSRDSTLRMVARIQALTCSRLKPQYWLDTQHMLHLLVISRRLRGAAATVGAGPPALPGGGGAHRRLDATRSCRLRCGAFPGP